jgi:hypothetical protein
MPKQELGAAPGLVRQEPAQTVGFVSVELGRVPHDLVYEAVASEPAEPVVAIAREPEQQFVPAAGAELPGPDLSYRLAAAEASTVGGVAVDELAALIASEPVRLVARVPEQQFGPTCAGEVTGPRW